MKRMHRREFLSRGLPAAAGVAGAAMVRPARAAAKKAAAAGKPNIVVILVDDMGFSDRGCYGGEIRPPHLDKLARGGIRLSQFYNTAKCSPTREADAFCRWLSEKTGKRFRLPSEEQWEQDSPYRARPASRAPYRPEMKVVDVGFRVIVEE